MDSIVGILEDSLDAAARVPWVVFGGATPGADVLHEDQRAIHDSLLDSLGVRVLVS